MLFNSLQYLIFFPLVVGAFFALPHRFRWLLLLAASYYFYMCWKPEYALLIFVSTLIDYWAALQMGKTGERRGRRKYLVLSLVANLGILFSFKYFNFFNDSIRALCDSVNIFYGVSSFDLLLPVGISFYTFQTLSYTIDVYKGTRRPERHFGIFAVYVSFFPQLVAGPIERSTRLMPQFFEKKKFEYDRVVSGLQLVLWGLFKKIVIADRLAVYVNQVYNHPGDFSGGPLILATYFFAFQIYCDFSGYSDIAIGSARILGFDLMQNFRRPYFAQSIADFWQRWHISLSTWFRDYLYIPLGGNRVVKWRWYYNLMIVFVLSGLWHGANWTFLVWGALHGGYMVVSNWTKPLRTMLARRLNLSPRLAQFVRIGFTFHLVLFAWIFFRANSMSDAIQILTSMPAIDFPNLAANLTTGFYAHDLSRGWFDLSVAFGLIGVLTVVQWYQHRGGLQLNFAQRPTWQRWSIYYAAVIGIILLGVYEHAEFIYFQF
jgi:D-alanyl-lipoteichoic acid acyltransferase DltB (MBOAT superfamily)